MLNPMKLLHKSENTFQLMSGHSDIYY